MVLLSPVTSIQTLILYTESHFCAPHAPVLLQTLTQMAPYQIYFGSLTVHMIHADKINRSETLAAMNGRIVALCRLPSTDNPDVFGNGWVTDSGDNGTDGGSQTPRFLQLPPHDGPQPIFPCFGLGLVRAVDLTTGKLYIATPVQESVLEEKVNLVVLGATDLHLPTDAASLGETGGLAEPCVFYGWWLLHTCECTEGVCNAKGHCRLVELKSNIHTLTRTLACLSV